MSSHNIWIVPVLWSRVLAAVKRMEKRGEGVSLSVFICRGIERELEAEEAVHLAERGAA